MAFWEGFQNFFKEEEDTSVTKEVSSDVLDSFNIRHINDRGGLLKNIDIKRADAFSVLKASLLELYAQDSSTALTEVHINEDGDAVFYEVGESSSSLHIYYSITSSTYINPKIGVIVTGAKPRQKRIVPSKGSNASTGGWLQIIGPNSKSSFFDATRLTTGCVQDSFSTHAVITYNDPFRHNPNSNWNNGVKDLYEPESPFDRLIGVSWRINVPEDLVTVYTKIYQQSQSAIPVVLGDFSKSSYYIGSDSNFPPLGTLRKRKNRNMAGPDVTNCIQYEDGEEFCSSSTVPIPIQMIENLTYETLRGTTINKFLGVQGVFLFGMALSSCYGIAQPGKQKEANTAENSALFVASYDTKTIMYRLNEGVHYTILYPKDLKESPETFGLPCIQFANNLREKDYAPVGTNVPFYIDSTSSNLLRIYGDTGQGVGSIFPLENKGGILVESIWVQISLDTPSFLVVDPSGNAARIAKKMTVEIIPLILRDEPSPIAINGELIDQIAGMADNDPTTTQDFTKTPLEIALNKASSGRTLSLTLASLDETQTTTLSKKLYNLLASDTGKSYTHTCSPTSRPVIGSRGPNGGIINTIEYSYTDQGSYLITVTEGPVFFGDFSGIDGGIYYKKVDDTLTTQGTIIQDRGNHVDYKVLVDGIGVIECINGCASVLMIRDRVTVTIHNNAAEK